MVVYSEVFKVQSELIPTFHDVTEKVQEILHRSGIANGITVVYSQHTTCSVLIQEDSHDENYWGTKLIMQDLVNALDEIIPACRTEGEYLHPGPKHIEVAISLNEKPAWSLNTDAHLRSVILGRSESIPVIDSRLELGQFGRIYFADFDQVRARERKVIVQIVGE
jgi:secondary thiamine-phosphate synthase enzyme